MPKIADWDDREKVICEFEAIGFYLSSHPLDQYRDILGQTSIITSDYLKHEHMMGYTIVELAGMIISSKAKVSPKGRYLQAVLSDHYGSVEISFFDNDLLRVVAQLFEQNVPLIIKAEIRKDEGGIRVTGQSVSVLDEYLSEKIQRLELLIKSKSAIAELKTTLANKNKGNSEIILRVAIEDVHEVIIDLQQKFKLTMSDCRAIKSIKGISDLAILLKHRR